MTADGQRVGAQTAWLSLRGDRCAPLSENRVGRHCIKWDKRW